MNNIPKTYQTSEARSGLIGKEIMKNLSIEFSARIPGISIFFLLLRTESEFLLFAGSPAEGLKLCDIRNIFELENNGRCITFRQGGRSNVIMYANSNDIQPFLRGYLKDEKINLETIPFSFSK